MFVSEPILAGYAADGPHSDRHGHILALPPRRLPRTGTTPRRIEARRDPHIAVGRADVVGGIEADPAEMGHQRLRPGMARGCDDVIARSRDSPVT